MIIIIVIVVIIITIVCFVSWIWGILAGPASTVAAALAGSGSERDALFCRLGSEFVARRLDSVLLF